MNPLAKLLPQRDVADQFNVSECTLVRWRSERKFPAPHRIGKRNYYLPQELTDWVDVQINNEKAITLNIEQFREKQSDWRLRLISHKQSNGHRFNARTLSVAIALQDHEHAAEDEDQGTACPGHQRIAEMVGIGGSRETQLREVSRALKPLAESGFIVKIREGKSVDGEEVVTAKWRLVIPAEDTCVGV